MKIGARVTATALYLVPGLLNGCAPSPLYVATGTSSAPGSVPRDVNGDPILPTKTAPPEPQD